MVMDDECSSLMKVGGCDWLRGSPVSLSLSLSLPPSLPARRRSLPARLLSLLSLPDQLLHHLPTCAHYNRQLPCYSFLSVFSLLLLCLLLLSVLNLRSSALQSYPLRCNTALLDVVARCQVTVLHLTELKLGLWSQAG
jgi:hypothetical protein